jgi:hypothetical protein
MESSIPTEVCDSLTDKTAVGVGKIVYMPKQHNTVNSTLDGFVG